MPFVESQGRKIHYLEAGTGTPVVLVHSGGLSSRQWARLVNRLAPNHHAIAIDLLGSGLSDPVPPDQPFDFAQDVAALAAVLATQPPPYHFVGHSYGGLLALTYARTHPTEVRSIALFEPVAFGVLYSKGDAAAIHDLEGYDHDGTFFSDAEGGGEAWLERFIDWWQGQGAWQGLPEPSRAAFRKVGRKVFQEVRSLTADRTPHQAYAVIEAPALLMTGALSPLAARTVCAILAEAMPRGELMIVEDGGHMAPLTHGQLVGERIVAHIRSA